MEPRFLDGAQTGFTRSQNTRTEADIAMEETAETQSSLQSIEAVNVAPSNMNIGLTPSNYTGTALQAEEVTLLDRRNTPLISTMVFHFFRADDNSKQDIVCMDDILDYSTNGPSWTKLLEILAADDGFGMAFKEGREFLIVNDRIRVANGRQFLACLQYLQNSNTLNSVAFVYGGASCQG